MIVETTTYRCTRCGSTNLVRNGHNSTGSPKYRYCGASRVLQPKVRYSEEQKVLILRTYQERARAVQRLFGVSRPTLSAWIQKKPGACPS